MSALTVHDHGGDGPGSLLLVHGVTDDGTCWPDAVEHWLPHWRVFSVDLRGHGSSPRFAPDDIARAAEVHQADLVEVLRGLDRPVLVGHSLGGVLSARVGRDTPDLVRALVLEDPARPRASLALDDQFGREQVAFADAVTSDPEGEIARMRRETQWSDTELLPWAASKADVDRAYLRSGLSLGDRSWEIGLFDRLRVPTLLVVPEDGEMAPDASLYDNPAVRTVTVAGAGHCVRRDRPEAYFEAVDAFLAGLD